MEHTADVPRLQFEQGGGGDGAQVKTCYGCGVAKPLEDYYRHSQSKDGRHPRCADCMNPGGAERRARNRERVELAQRGLKRCTKCEGVKELADFPTDRRKADGRGSWCRRCLHEAEKRWRADNPDAIRAIRRRWRKKNPGRGTRPPEQVGAERRANTEFYEEHGHPRIIVGEKGCNGCGQVKPAAAFNVAKRNPNGLSAHCSACVAEESRKRRERDPEMNGRHGKRWRERNPEKQRVRKQRRRARLAKAAGEWTAKQWAALVDFYGGVCLRCGSGGPMTFDHVVPLAEGGDNTILNAQPLCKPCNCSKGVKTVDYRDRDGQAAFLLVLRERKLL